MSQCDSSNRKRKRSYVSDFKSKYNDSKSKSRESSHDRRDKGKIPIGEQCRRTNCKQRGSYTNHRHKDCRYKNGDQTSPKHPNADSGIKNGNNPLDANLASALYRGDLHTLLASVTAGMNYVGDPSGFYNPNANTGVDIHNIAGQNNPQSDYMSAGINLAMFQRGGAEDQRSQS
jgi:hypothetical protein